MPQPRLIVVCTPSGLARPSVVLPPRRIPLIGASRAPARAFIDAVPNPPASACQNPRSPPNRPARAPLASARI